MKRIIKNENHSLVNLWHGIWYDRYKQEFTDEIYTRYIRWAKKRTQADWLLLQVVCIVGQKIYMIRKDISSCEGQNSTFEKFNFSGEAKNYFFPTPPNFVFLAWNILNKCIF